eukprot:1646831-Pyramimonas_sp.AAC.1
MTRTRTHRGDQKFGFQVRPVSNFHQDAAHIVTRAQHGRVVSANIRDENSILRWLNGSQGLPKTLKP